MWDVEEIRSIGFPDHQQKVTFLGSKHDVGVTMDRRKCDEVLGIEDTHGGIDTRYRLQQENRVV